MNPLGHLPDFMKDPANYEKIEAALLTTKFCGVSHSDVSQMFDCVKCQEKAIERRALMKKFGLRNAGEYLEWKKIHAKIKERVPLPKYNS